MKKELKIGVFSISVIVASFFMINYLRGTDIFNREIELIGSCEDVQGLTATAPVYIKGYKAGRVSSVDYDTEKGRFYVVCSVSKKFNLPADSKMYIYSFELMGGKALKIEVGQSDQTLNDGDTLAIGYEPGVFDALSQSITPLVSSANNTLDSLNVAIAGVNRMLSETNVANISSTLANLDATMSNVQEISSAVNEKSKEITDLITNISEFSSDLKNISAKLDTAATGVNQAVATVNQADIDGMVTSFRSLVDNINDPDGSLGKLINDGSVYNSVDSLLVDINLIVDKIKENPKKYLKISLF